MDEAPPRYDYVAYIDESGDPGLRVVKPLDPNGSSEWIVVAATVIRAESEPKVGDWVAEMMARIGSRQLLDLHFADLNPWKRRICCEVLATKEVRCFVFVSNKQNMKGWKNPFAEKIPSNNWFYCWLTRVLLERVTHFVKNIAIKEHGEPRCVKLVFSERGGMRYPQMNAYYTYLKWQDQGGGTWLQQGKIRHEVLHPLLMDVYNHTELPGLKLPDIVAGAFFKAVDIWDTRACDPQFAQLLRPRMGRYPFSDTGRISGYGVKAMPKWRQLVQATQPAQREILEYYGYPRQWWDEEGKW
jgi:hypothetical protein